MVAMVMRCRPLLNDGDVFARESRMEAIRIQGGYRFRLANGPKAEISTLTSPTRVAACPRGVRGVKCKVVVNEGDKVVQGQKLFYAKKNPSVIFTAPAAGTVKEIVYGPRRRLDAVVIDTEGDDAHDFGAHDRGSLAGLGEQKVTDKLVESGLWPRMVAFPNWEVAPASGYEIPHTDEHSAPPPKKTLKAIYVSAITTEPHLPSPSLVMQDHEETFAAGLEVIKQVAKKTWLISGDDEKLPATATSVTGVQHRRITAKYPAENVAVQLWYTEPLGPNEVAVGLRVEDVIDIGHLFLTGKLRNEHTYSVAGDAASDRKHVRAPIGVRVGDLAGAVTGEEIRYIAGGMFTGDKVGPDEYMSAFDASVQVMEEDHYREPLAMFKPGFNRFSLFRLWASTFIRGDKEMEVTTSNNGEERACVQCTKCIDVCPVSLMPNLVFKAALAEDFEKMEETGIHDCADCGLCTFVCPSKIELGAHIEAGKALIAKEG